MKKNKQVAPQSPIKCCLCGATNKTLYKGEAEGETMYICKSCYILVQKAKGRVLQRQNEKETKPND